MEMNFVMASSHGKGTAENVGERSPLLLILVCPKGNQELQTDTHRIAP